MTINSNINKINHYQKAISSRTISIDKLKQIKSNIERIENQARDCIERASDRLKTINDILQENHLSIDQQADDYKYLVNKQEKNKKQLSQCRLLLFKAKDLSSQLLFTLSEKSTEKLYKKTTPVWDVSKNLSTSVWSTIKPNTIYQSTGIKQITPIASVTLVFLLIIGFVACYLLNSYITQHYEQQLFKIPYQTALVKSLNKFGYFILLSVILSAFCFLYFSEDSVKPSIVFVCYALSTFLILCAVAYFLLSPQVEEFNPLLFSKGHASNIYYRVVLLLGLLLIGYVINVLFIGQNVSETLIEIYSTVFLVVVSFAVFWLCWTLLQSIPTKNTLVVLLKTILLASIILIVISELLGYHTLNIYIIKGVITTLFWLFLSWLIVIIIENLINSLNTNTTWVTSKIRYYLGIRLHSQSINELIILRLALYLLVACALVYLIMSAWDSSVLHLNQFEDAIFEGFQFANIKIYPSKIILALFVFVIINLIGRFIAAFIRRRKLYDEDLDKQVAIASIINYITFGVALVIALLTAGVNFTGLAIIIGALSVGVGLGLQSIVNNFISGIILLLEKPIKPGDRIVVDNVEGIVKRVRIRSTRITTLAKEDVIIPNADLVSNQVTNYMFRDRTWRVVVNVGVAYGSDVDRVRKILLDIAHQHPDVLNNKPNAPVVLFKSFGDNSLLFELWCIIDDVNKKFHVTSDLNFAINREFAKHHVRIAFPQLDVHINDNRE